MFYDDAPVSEEEYLRNILRQQAGAAALKEFTTGEKPYEAMQATPGPALLPARPDSSAFPSLFSDGNDRLPSVQVDRSPSFLQNLYKKANQQLTGDVSAFPQLFAPRQPAPAAPTWNQTVRAAPSTEVPVAPTGGFFDEDRGFFGNTFGAMDVASKIRSAFQNYDPNIRAQQAAADAQIPQGFFKGTVDTLLNSAPAPFASIYGAMEQQAGMPQLMSNEAGPLAPGARRSEWRNDNGVMINDGSEMVGTPTSFDPGAGYVRHTRDGIVPIAAPGDADWNNRTNMEPYTNPLIQQQARDQAFRRDQLERSLSIERERTAMMRESKEEATKTAAEAKFFNNLNRTPEGQRRPMIEKGMQDGYIDKTTGKQTIVEDLVKDATVGNTSKEGKVDVRGFLTKLKTQYNPNTMDKGMLISQLQNLGMNPQQFQELADDPVVGVFAKSLLGKPVVRSGWDKTKANLGSAYNYVESLVKGGF